MLNNFFLTFLLLLANNYFFFFALFFGRMRLKKRSEKTDFANFDKFC